MKRITDCNDLLRDVSGFRKSHRPTYTNFFLFGDQLRHFVEQERIFCELLDDCLIIYEDEKEYYHYYYCVNTDVALPSGSTDKDCVAYMVYNKRTDRKEVEGQRDKLLKAGFRYAARSFQYAKKIGGCEDSIRHKFRISAEKAKGKGIQMRFMGQEDYAEIDALWRMCFDRFRIPDISRELRELADDKRILLACKKDDGTGNMQVIGSQFMDFQGKTVHTHKTCVHADFRGFGVGKLLVLAALEEALKRGCNRWQVEMDEGNTASEEMHAAALGERLERSGVMSEMWTRTTALNVAASTR